MEYGQEVCKKNLQDTFHLVPVYVLLLCTCTNLKHLHYKYKFIIHKLNLQLISYSLIYHLYIKVARTMLIKIVHMSLFGFIFIFMSTHIMNEIFFFSKYF